MKIFYNSTGFISLLKREIHRFMKVYIQTLIAPLISNMLFLGVFGGMLRTRELGVEGVGYLSFLVPGLCAMGAIFAAFQNPSFSLIAQKFQGTVQDINSYPISTMEKVLAFVLGGTIRGFFIGTMTYIATIFFVGYTISNPILFFSMLIIVSFIFATLGLVVGLTTENFEKMNFLLAIILTPMTYFGGVFFEVSRLPGILSNLAYANPLFPLINLVRYGYIGFYEGNLILQVSYLIIIFFTTFIFSYTLLKKGVGLKS